MVQLFSDSMRKSRVSQNSFFAFPNPWKACMLSICEDGNSRFYVPSTSDTRDYSSFAAPPQHPIALPTLVIFQTFNSREGVTICSDSACYRWRFGEAVWTLLTFAPLYPYRKSRYGMYDRMVWITGGIDVGAPPTGGKLLHYAVMPIGFFFKRCHNKPSCAPFLFCHSTWNKNLVQKWVRLRA